MISCVLLAFDVGAPRVPFEQLAAFPALRDVSLQCNGLRHLSNPGGFAVLEVRGQVCACAIYTVFVGMLACSVQVGAAPYACRC
jgi:hypothetical protein